MMRILPRKEQLSEDQVNTTFAEAKKTRFGKVYVLQRQSTESYEKFTVNIVQRIWLAIRYGGIKKYAKKYNWTLITSPPSEAVKSQIVAQKSQIESLTESQITETKLTDAKMDEKPSYEEIEREKIHPFKVTFTGKSSQEQADEIFSYIQDFLSQHKDDDTPPRFAITYSANNDQAEEIYKGYQTGKYSIGGANQAGVFRVFVEKIHHESLEDQIHVLPIPTCKQAGGANISSEEDVQKALENLAQHLGAGWYVLGLQNERSTDENPLAIGGGVAVVWSGSELEKTFIHKTKEMLTGNVPGDLGKAYQAGRDNPNLLLKSKT